MKDSLECRDRAYARRFAKRAPKVRCSERTAGTRITKREELSEIRGMVPTLDIIATHGIFQFRAHYQMPSRERLLMKFLVAQGRFKRDYAVRIMSRR
jgi:hypothetical protein